MMQIWLAVLLIVLALIGGVALGFFIARKYMMSYLKKNPPINEQRKTGPHWCASGKREQKAQDPRITERIAIRASSITSTRRQNKHLKI